jgi:hypothetical protein
VASIIHRYGRRLRISATVLPRTGTGKVRRAALKGLIEPHGD